ncbi:hypothetical protein SS50377_22244 [Spironucleus salmonicida]|uniref:Uncharacterized protein n=1 Tax=Spironucleus salmonicida TaxID=348837 RepID=V6LNF6_9EUKA|nr:hypothetical protein SS50377_22244 [Spironucleus salmonicida]|eukprot:EST42264.1 Hypothetical protein SS50377_18564 [Spironucleus salmonicida]
MIKQPKPKLLQKSVLSLEQSLIHTSKNIDEMEIMTVKDHIIDLTNDLSLKHLQSQVPQYEQTQNVQNQSLYVENFKILEESLRFKTGANQEISSIKKQLKLLEREFESQIKLNQLSSDATNNQVKNIFMDIINIMEHLQKCEKLIKQRDKRYIQSTYKQSVDLRIIKRVLQKSGLFAEYISGNKEKYIDKSKLRTQSGYQNSEVDELKVKVKQFSVQVFTLQEQVKFIRDSLGQKSEIMKDLFQQKLREQYNELTDQININQRSQEEFLTFYNQKVEQQQEFLNELQSKQQSSYLQEQTQRQEITELLKNIQQKCELDLKQVKSAQKEQEQSLFANKTYIQELQVEKQQQSNSITKLQKQADTLFRMNKDYIDDFNNFVQTSQIHQLQIKIESYQDALEKYEIKMQLIQAQNDHLIKQHNQQTDKINQFQIENKQLQFDQQQVLNKQILQYSDMVQQLNSTKDSFSIDNFNQMISTRVQSDILPYQHNVEAVKQQLISQKEQSNLYDKKLINLTSDIQSINDEITNLKNFSISENEIIGESSRFDFKDIKEIKQHQRLQSSVIQSQRKMIDDIQTNNQHQKQAFQTQVNSVQVVIQSAKRQIKNEIKDLIILKEDITKKYKDIKKIEIQAEKSEQDISGLVLDIERCKIKIDDLQKKETILDGALVNTNYTIQNFVETTTEMQNIQLNEFRAILINQSSQLQNLTESSSLLKNELSKCISQIEDIQFFTNQAFAQVQNTSSADERITEAMQIYEDTIKKQNKQINKIQLQIQHQLDLNTNSQQSFQELQTKINSLALNIQITEKIPQLISNFGFLQKQFERIQKELTLNK